MGRDFGQPGGLFYEDYHRHKIVMDISNKAESTTHHYCTQLFQAESNEKAISLLEPMGNMNLEQVPEISFESEAYFKKP